MCFGFYSWREGVHHRKPFDDLSQVVQEVAVNCDGGMGEYDPLGIDVMQRAVPVGVVKPAERRIFKSRLPLCKIRIVFIENKNVELTHLDCLEIQP